MAGWIDRQVDGRWMDQWVDGVVTQVGRCIDKQRVDGQKDEQIVDGQIKMGGQIDEQIPVIDGWVDGQMVGQKVDDFRWAYAVWVDGQVDGQKVNVQINGQMGRYTDKQMADGQIDGQTIYIGGQIGGQMVEVYMGQIDGQVDRAASVGLALFL